MEKFKTCEYCDVDYIEFAESEFIIYKCNIFDNENGCKGCEQINNSNYYDPSCKYFERRTKH